MADNFIADAGSGGKTFGSDEISGVDYPRCKIIIGADGTNDGDVASANPLPCTLKASTASIGKLAANDGVDIGNVDVASSALPTGAATAANQLPDGHNVTIDNAAGAAAVNIQDGGNSITIDGTITANAGTNLNTSALALESGGNLDTIAGDTTSIDGKITACNTGDVVISSSALPSGAATSALQTTGNTSLATIAGAVDGTEMQCDIVASLPAGTNNIGDVDILSIVPGTGASNLGKAEDAAHTTGDVGVMGLVVRSDSGGAIAGTDGDYTPMQVDASGNLRVNVAAGSASGTEYTEDAAAPSNPEGPTKVMVRADTPAAVAGTDGDWVTQRATNYGAGYVQVVDSSGNFIDTFGGSGGTASTDDSAFTAGSGQGTPMMGFATSDSVDAGDVGVVAMDTDRNLKISIEADNVGIGGGTQYTEDDAAAANPIGNMNICVRADSLAGVTSTDGDNIALRATNNGELYVKQTDAVPVTDNGGSLTVDGTVTANAGTNLNTSALALESGGNLDTIAGDTTSIDGKITACNTGAVVVSSGSITEDNSADILTSLQLIDNAVDGNYLNVNCNIAGTDFVGGAGAVAAGVQRTTLASDDPAVALLGTIDADTSTLAGAVSGSEMQVDVVAALPAGDNNIGNVDIASALPAGTNAIGKLAANSGVDIGDVDVTSITNGSLNGPAEPTIDSYTQAAINLTTGTNQVLVSSSASKQIWVYGVGFTCGDADGQTVSFQDEDDTAITGIMEFAQYGGLNSPPSGNFAMPMWKLGTNKDLEVDITGGDVDGWLAYAIVSV